MKCTEIRRLFKYNYQNHQAIPEKVMAHIKLCDHCREAMAVERLTAALLSAYASSDTSDKEPAGEPPYLMSRIRARIRELSDQGVGSWESAILALRGWIIAFGAAAILLLTLSVQGRLSNAPGIDPIDDATSVTNISEDFISSVGSVR
jgi:hypothetical protein